MPTFKYSCRCGHEFTKLLHKPEDVIMCPECQEKAKRLFVAPAVHFKGDGFYCNQKNEEEYSKNNN